MQQMTSCTIHLYAGALIRKTEIRRTGRPTNRSSSTHPLTRKMGIRR